MKKALLIGINKYRLAGSDLRGCINDIKTITPILTDKFKFKPDDLSIMMDFQCTTSEIKKQIEKICSDAKSGDTIFIHFSGHGSQIIDYDEDEIDKLDEIICPYDLDFKKNVISDDYLYSVFKTLDENIQLVVVSDSCHSGSLLRNTPGHYLVPRYIKPPIEILDKISQLKSQIYLNDEKMNQLSKLDNKKENFNKRPGILLSGCKSNQFSADTYIDKKYQGAFTYSLSHVLKTSNYDITYSELIKKINFLLSKLGYSQNPQLEAPDKFLNSKFLGEL